MKRTANDGKNRRRSSIVTTWEQRVEVKGMGGIDRAAPASSEALPKMTQVQAMLKAYYIINTKLREGWPVSDEVRIGEDWRVHLFQDEISGAHAILYPTGSTAGTLLRVNK